MLISTIFGTDVFVINSYSQTLSRINLETNEVNNTFAMLGLAPNHMAIKDHFGYVVISGANSVQKIDLETGHTVTNIFIADSSNPYDITIQGDFAYVTGLFTNKVYKVSLLTDQVTNSISVGLGPEGMCVADNKLYVANTGNYPNYTPSTVSVINLDSFSILDTIPVEMNPQYLAYADGYVHVVCTGNWSDINGKICLIDPNTDSVSNTLTIGGNLGNIWISPGHIAYVAEGLNTGIYRYNTQTLSIMNSISNPFTPGGSCVWGNSDYVGIVDAQWGQNGIVRLVNQEGVVMHTYTVGMSPTDIRFYSGSTPVDDEVAAPISKLDIYPNPSSTMNTKIHVRFSSKAFQPSCIFELYNIRGQKVRTYILNSEQTINEEAVLDIHDLRTGVYLGILKNGRQQITKKFSVIK